jgi:WD40 repeat protein
VLWGHNHWVRAIEFSPDGQTMASSTGDPGPNAIGEVKLWDAVTGHVRATFPGQTVPIAFAPDGRTLVTGNHDETINLPEAAPEFPGR